MGEAVRTPRSHSPGGMEHVYVQQDGGGVVEVVRVERATRTGLVHHAPRPGRLQCAQDLLGARVCTPDPASNHTVMYFMQQCCFG